MGYPRNRDQKEGRKLKGAGVVPSRFILLPSPSHTHPVFYTIALPRLKYLKAGIRRLGPAHTLLQVQPNAAAATPSCQI